MGKDAARKTANNLKKETESEQQVQSKEMEKAVAVFGDNKELAQMYQDNAQVGSSNLVGELPMLKIHAVGRSTKNELANGKEPKDGWFFYRPDQSQFETIDCHILTISKGFRAKGMKGNDGKEPKVVFNQLMAGVIVNTDDISPFIMYLTGLKLQPMWDFGKEAAQYTRAKPIPIPMFALSVRLTTKQVTHDFGKSWIVNFEIIKEKSGVPKLIVDSGKFQYLKDHVATMENTISSVIAVKSNEEDESPGPEEGDRSVGVEESDF